MRDSGNTTEQLSATHCLGVATMVGYLILRAVNFPDRMGPTLVNFLSWGMSPTALLL